MLTHRVIDNRSKHLFHLIRVERARRPSTPNKEQVRVSPQIYIPSVEPVESGDHYHEPLAHSTLEEFSSDVVPFVQPVVYLPHLLQLPVRILHGHRPRQLLQRLRHVISKQQYRLRRFPEPLEQFIDILEQCWKIPRSTQRLHISLTIPPR